LRSGGIGTRSSRRETIEGRDARTQARFHEIAEDNHGQFLARDGPLYSAMLYNVVLDSGQEFMDLSILVTARSRSSRRGSLSTWGPVLGTASALANVIDIRARRNPRTVRVFGDVETTQDHNSLLAEVPSRRDVARMFWMRQATKQGRVSRSATYMTGKGGGRTRCSRRAHSRCRRTVRCRIRRRRP
jgi:hypothetical protein